MNRLALELLALISPTPQPALGLAERLAIPPSGRGVTVRSLCRSLRRRKLAVRYASGRCEEVQTLSPELVQPAVFYVWVEEAFWPAAQAAVRRYLDYLGNGIACRWCGGTRPMPVTNTYRRDARLLRRRVCRDCGKPNLTEEKLLIGSRTN